ncbi:MAG: (2Fe-2S) ferredoxin domain-containing protein [bacterium]|nr:(2Fe-2S) ferredoxin domain-containing protein [bacterium]
MTYYTKHVLLCTNQKAEGKPCCANSGGDEFFHYMKLKVSQLGLHGPGLIRISKTGCLGRCGLGPCLVIYPEGIWYSYASFADIESIIENHLVAGNTVKELLIDRE